jgi:tetratricopeptide (TPR) repeat protein
MEYGHLDPGVAAVIQETLGQIESDPQNSEPRLRLGMVYQASEIFDLAATAYEQVLTLDPTVAKAWYHLARVRDRMGDLDGAIEAMSRMIEVEQGYGPAFWRRGEWLLDRRDLEQAEADFRRAIEVDPGNPAGQVGLARVHLERGQAQEAADLLEGLMARGDQPAYVHLLLGNAYRQLGEMERAEHELKLGSGQGVVRDDPWSTELLIYQVGFNSRIQLALRYLGAGQIDDGIQLLEQLRIQQPGNVRVLTKLGQAYIQAGRFDDALEVLEDAVLRHPDNFSVHNELSAAYRFHEQWDKALVHAERALEIKPESATAHARRGALLQQQGKSAEAEEEFETAVRYAPNTHQFVRALGDCQSMREKWTEAVASYERAVVLKPDSPELLARLGFAATKQGNLERAEQALSRAVELTPQAPEQWRVLLEQVQRLRSGRSGSGGAQGAP